MYFNACAWKAFAGEMAFFGLRKVDRAVDGGMDGKVAADKSTWAGNFSSANLTYDNFARFNGLATKTFDTKTLAGIVVKVFAGSASFDV